MTMGFRPLLQSTRPFGHSLTLSANIHTANTQAGISLYINKAIETLGPYILLPLSLLYLSLMKIPASSAYLNTLQPARSPCGQLSDH